MRLLKQLFLILLLSFPYWTVEAQSTDTADTETGFWTHYARTVTTLGHGNALGITLEHRNHLFSLRTASTGPFPGSDTWDIALLYGRLAEVGAFQLTGGFGVSTIRGEKYPRLFGGSSEGRMEPMIGFPLEGRISWPATRFVAFDIYGFGNVNTQQPIFGIGVGMHVGIIR